MIDNRTTTNWTIVRCTCVHSMGHLTPVSSIRSSWGILMIRIIHSISVFLILFLELKLI